LIYRGLEAKELRTEPAAQSVRGDIERVLCILTGRQLETPSEGKGM
jgi:hypothetical protein